MPHRNYFIWNSYKVSHAQVVVGVSSKGRRLTRVVFPPLTTSAISWYIPNSVINQVILPRWKLLLSRLTHENQLHFGWQIGERILSTSVGRNYIQQNHLLLPSIEQSFWLRWGWLASHVEWRKGNMWAVDFLSVWQVLMIGWKIPSIIPHSLTPFSLTLSFLFLFARWVGCDCDCTKAEPILMLSTRPEYQWKLFDCLFVLNLIFIVFFFFIFSIESFHLVGWLAI